MKKIKMFSRLYRNLYFKVDQSSGKFDPVHEEAGGGAVTTGPVLARLGFDVELHGRCSPEQEPLRDLLTSQGIRCFLPRVEAPAAVNAILPNLSILRVTSHPPIEPTPEAVRAIGADGDVFVLVGSLDRGCAQTVIELAAARGAPCFVNPGASFDLDLLDQGGVIHLQVSYDELGRDSLSPAALARNLLVRTAAASVVVTAAERGAWGITRGDRSVLHAPAIPRIEPVRLLGAGDAHFGGFIATFLDAPKEIRLQQALSVARLVAARHVAGLRPGDWVDLSRFQAQLSQAPSVRAVA